MRENSHSAVLLEYVDHCFGISRVPYLSLIFVLRYIVGSPLFLVIHGSKLTRLLEIAWNSAAYSTAFTLTEILVDCDHDCGHSAPRKKGDCCVVAHIPFIQ